MFISKDNMHYSEDIVRTKLPVMFHTLKLTQVDGGHILLSYNELYDKCWTYIALCFYKHCYIINDESCEYKSG